MPLGDIFKSKKELEDEQKRLQKKELRDANRTVERLKTDLERQEKELEAQIRAAASKNDSDLAKTLAKQLVKVRNEKVRAVGAKSKISSVTSHASTIQTNNKLAQIMATSSSAIARVNQQLKPEQLAKQISDFQSETTKMDMKESAMEDMFDEIFEDEDEEADSIMNQVLDEISIETGSKLAGLPATSKAATAASALVKDASKPSSSGVRNANA